MKKKAIIFDIDGTVVNSPRQKLPSPLLVEVVRKLEDSYYFSAATGRVWSFAKPVLKAMSLKDPCIISAGTQICNPQTGEILWQKNIADDSLDEVIEIFRQKPEYKLLYNDGTEDDYFHGGVDPKDFTHNEPVYFLEQVFIPDHIAIEIHKKLNQVSGITCVMVVSQKSGCRDLHVVNSSATKEHSIKELLSILKINKEDSVGIGDGHNDIHLFNAVHYKVAMGNSVPELKELADEVVDTVVNDGMAKYLNSLDN